MNTIIQGDKNHIKTCMEAKCFEESKKYTMYLAKKIQDFAFFSPDLRRNFGSDVGNMFGVIMRGRGHHSSEIAFHMVRQKL